LNLSFRGVRCKDGGFAAFVQSLVPRGALATCSARVRVLIDSLFSTFNGDCVIDRVPHCSHVCGCLYIYLDFVLP
jgi:hypothetical protein